MTGSESEQPELIAAHICHMDVFEKHMSDTLLGALSPSDKF
jgi:hypothetical protein